MIPLIVNCTVIESIQQITVTISESTQIVNADVEVHIQGVAETYTGDYIVTPSIREQTLYTNKKYMTDDVTIREIPYFEVSNLNDGITVFIADNINDD